MTLIQEIYSKKFLGRYKTPILVVLFLNLIASPVLADFTITSVPSGASAADLTLTTPEILASIGTVSCTAWDSDNDKDPNTGCAITPIPSSSSVEICLTHSNDSDVNIYAQSSLESTASQVSPIPSLSGISKGDTTCAKFLWSSICDAINKDFGGNADSSCEDNFSGSLYLIGDTKDTSYDSGEDFSKKVSIKYSNYSSAAAALSTTANCTGTTSDKPCILQYGFVPGDNKAVIFSTQTPYFVINESGGWPSVSGHLRVKYVRFYYGVTTNADDSLLAAQDVDINTENFVDIEIDDEGNFSKNSIGGLINDTKYAIRAAVVDEAGSVGYMLDAASTVAMAVGEYDFVVTPSEVFGIFEESRCFIATAAYGSPFAPKLTQLRDFRDQILAKSQWGRKLISFYYANSPKWAAKLFEHPNLQKLVQVFLWPAWAFSSLSLIIGMGPASGILFMTLALIVLCLRRLKPGGSKL